LGYISDKWQGIKKPFSLSTTIINICTFIEQADKPQQGGGTLQSQIN